MEVQIYENNYRIRNHWHFIERQSKSQRINNKEERKVRSNASSPEETSPQPSKSKSPERKYTEVEVYRREDLIRDQFKKLQAKEFVSRVRKEKEEANGKYFLLKKSNNSGRRSEEEQKGVKYQQRVVLPKKQRRLSPIVQYKLQQKVRRIKMQNLSKSTMPNSQAREAIAKPSPKPSRKVQSFSIVSPKVSPSQQILHPNKKATKSSKPKIPLDHIITHDPSTSMQRWFYLSYKDEQTIDSIYLKLQHLSTQTSNPNPKKLKNQKRHRIKTVLS